MSDLKEFLNNFKECNVLVVGDVMLDRNVYGNSDRLSPEAPVPIVRFKRESYNLGGAGNVALNITNLSPNGKVHLFGFIGDDYYGKKLNEILEEKGINSYLEIDRIPTTLKERIIVEGRGQPQQIIRIDRESEEKKYFNKKDKLIKIAEESDIIVISDYAKGAVNSDLLKCLNDYRNKMVVDPKPRNPETMNLYKNVFMIKCNNQESIYMAKDLSDFLYSVPGECLRNHFNSNILITKGIEGMDLFPIDKTDGSYINKTNKQENFEPTGAGDTVIAVLSLSLAKNRSLDSILNGAALGNIAAGITVKHNGVYAPTFEELKSELENETSRFEFS